ncbi:hypothetical protein Tco_1484692 [Tanacetum coccineum]
MTIPFPSSLYDYDYDKENGSDRLKDLEAYSYGTTLHNDTLPQKEKDPGSFTLRCYINNVYFEKALADLGASICVMPFSTYTNLRLGELAHTKNQVDDLKPTIEEGEVVNEPKIDEVKTRNDNNMVNMIYGYPSYCDFDRKIHIHFVENMDAYRDEGMGEVIVGESFCKASYVEARRFKHLTDKQCNKIPQLLKVSKQDKMNEISNSYQKLKGFYNGILNLGPEFIRDEKIVERLTCGRGMKCLKKV